MTALLLLVGGLLAVPSIRAEDEDPSQSGARVEVGEPAPAFVLTTSEGGSRSLEERTGEGPTVLIFFRGAW